VDLDGTLVRTDLLTESICRLMRRPWLIPLLLVWLLKGRAHLKREAARRTAIEPDGLPYNKELLEWLREERSRGRKLLLVTSADEILASRISAYLGVFDEVLGSDGIRNLKGANKQQVLVSRFGEGGYDYAGDSHADVPVWRSCRAAVLVNAAPALADRVRSAKPLERVFARAEGNWRACRRALRLHQWAKNLLIFIPLVTAHRLAETELLLRSLLMFLAFGLGASATYLINDLNDLDSDRRHPTKRERPFASGAAPIAFAAVLIPLLLGGALVLVSLLGWPAAGVLLGYFAVTCLYSWYLKRVVLVDVFALAFLYTWRVIAGHVATGVAYSAWLLSLAIFCFLSLALAKRVSELAQSQTPEGALDRGYRAADRALLDMFGVSSAFLSALVFALYINSEKVVSLYRKPVLLWLLWPVLLYWLCRIWLLAHRGELHEDAIVFALRDPLTYALSAVGGLIMFLAARG
jgi:4-hydroxybenzoate polyprenyltransferase/phosphoserine phosphatase